jgi:2,5-diamino-6-(ribosylamino)-4(3H)-pyrimidinone 5'-phosphate reductase
MSGEEVRLRPYVTVFVTMSADGKIASRTRESRLSCPDDKRRLHRLRAIHDAVMVGANTVIIDNPRLTVRYVEGANPLRVVVDGALRSPVNARVFDVDEAPTTVFASTNAPAEKVESLQLRGVKVILLEPDDRGYSLKMRDVLKSLYVEGVRTLLVEGGGNLIWRLFREGLVDEYRVTVSPYILGGSEAVTPVEGEGFGPLSDWVRLELISRILCGCGQEVHLIYRVRHQL